MLLESVGAAIHLELPRYESRCTSGNAQSGRADQSRRDEPTFCSWCGCNGKMGESEWWAENHNEQTS